MLNEMLNMAIDDVNDVDDDEDDDDGVVTWPIGQPQPPVVVYP